MKRWKGKHAVKIGTYTDLRLAEWGKGGDINIRMLGGKGERISRRDRSV